MPIILPSPVRRFSQAEFADLSYAVMGCVFQIHRDLGRLFDEKIYKRELAYRCPGVQLEFPIEVTHASFRKLHYIDVLVDSGGPFELKTADAIAPRHRAQLLHYMLLAELGHGKLVNLRKEIVEHEFVNTTLTREERLRFKIVNDNWNEAIAGAEHFKEVLVTLLRDWGTGLDLVIYEQALTHFVGGQLGVLGEVKVHTSEHALGQQRMRLAAPLAAWALTALPAPEAEYQSHLRRMLNHTGLEAIFWANISLKTVTFTSLEQGSRKTTPT